MGSMHTGLEDRLRHLPELTRYFVERAKGEVGLIITGGYSPNYLGRLTPTGGSFQSKRFAKAHQSLTKAVHDAGAKICLQLLHAGRYSYHPFSVAPSRIKSPITPFTPFALPSFLVKKTIRDFAKAAANAKFAGYDGVEIMGSEGYLLHQFLSSRTNHRTDQWGGSFENRMRFPLEVVKKIRQTVGPNFILVFRLSLLDLVQDGSSPEETYLFARALEQAGVTLLNSGIGWHEARIPTIGSMVPRGAFAEITAELKRQVNIPVIATNRINDIEVAEKILTEGQADLISMARPFLADAQFVRKARENRPLEINPCIACNQACLDHIFNGRRASCLVNPSACEESNWDLIKAKHVSKNIAVVGAGPAGLNAALVLLREGNQVTLFEKSSVLGGQFNLAAVIPGKSEYHQSIRHWENELSRLGAKVILNKTMNTAEDLQGFHEVVIASGVRPRTLSIPGADLPHVYPYDHYLKNKINPGVSTVIIGAGGIGVDLATYLLHAHENLDRNPHAFFKHWGIDPHARSGLDPGFKPEKSALKITILQRSPGTLGRGLGKTTSWVHRLELKRAGVQYLNDLNYEKITPEGVWVKFTSGERKLIPGEQVIVCAGQESENGLVAICENAQIPYHLIGGAKLAGELDAKRAIREAWELAKV